MYKIVNRTNSPYDLQGAAGSVRVPAHGEVIGDFAPEYLDILRPSGMFEIEGVESDQAKPRRGRSRKVDADHIQE
jgi:hypothetical protein